MSSDRNPEGFQKDVEEVINPVKPVKAVFAKKNTSKRTKCIWGCGTEVLKANSECRKCRRSRVRIGLKKVRKAEGKRKHSALKYETAKQKFDRVKKPPQFDLVAAVKNTLGIGADKK